MAFQNKVVGDLFILASDHDKSREARVDDMVPLLLSAKEEKFLPDALAWRLTDQAWRDFKPQVLRHRVNK